MANGLRPSRFPDFSYSEIIVVSDFTDLRIVEFELNGIWSFFFISCSYLISETIRLESHHSELTISNDHS